MDCFIKLVFEKNVLKVYIFQKIVKRALKPRMWNYLIHFGGFSSDSYVK